MGYASRLTHRGQLCTNILLEKRWLKRNGLYRNGGEDYRPFPCCLSLARNFSSLASRVFVSLVIASYITAVPRIGREIMHRARDKEAPFAHRRMRLQLLDCTCAKARERRQLTENLVLPVVGHDVIKVSVVLLVVFFCDFYTSRFRRIKPFNVMDTGSVDLTTQKTLRHPHVQKSKALVLVHGGSRQHCLCRRHVPSPSSGLLGAPADGQPRPASPRRQTTCGAGCQPPP